MGSRDGETKQEMKENRWYEIPSTYKLHGTTGVVDMYVQDISTWVEDVSVSRIRSASSWRCWQLAPRSSRLSWRKTWAPSTRGEESTLWESPEKDLGHKILFLLLRLHSAWLTCDHSCILKRTCLYLCIPTVFIIVIVFYTHGAAEVKMVNVPKARNTYCAKCNKHGKFKVGITLIILLFWQRHLLFNSGDAVQEVCWE